MIVIFEWDKEENPEGKRPLGRPRHRWVGNSMIYLRGIG
jgi:hypothetical protein